MFGSAEYKLTDVNNAKAEMSFAAFASIVVHALGSCKASDRRGDGMGVDADCTFLWMDGRWKRAGFSAQLKATSQELPTTTYKGVECWAFPVDPKQLARYRASSNTTLILFLVLFPVDDDYEEWLRVVDDSTVLRNKIYWVRIEDAGDADSVVYIPTSNRLTQESLLREIVYPLEASHDY